MCISCTVSNGVTDKCNQISANIYEKGSFEYVYVYMYIVVDSGLIVSCSITNNRVHVPLCNHQSFSWHFFCSIQYTYLLCLQGFSSWQTSLSRPFYPKEPLTPLISNPGLSIFKYILDQVFTYTISSTEDRGGQSVTPSYLSNVTGRT